MILYLENTEHNIKILKEIYGQPTVGVGDSYLKVDTELREWRTTFTFNWLYNIDPIVSDIKVVMRIEKLKLI